MEDITIAKSTALLIVGIVILIIFTSLKAASTISLRTCANYKTQEEAQKHYTARLDRDKDGVACESLAKQ